MAAEVVPLSISPLDLVVGGNLLSRTKKLLSGCVFRVSDFLVVCCGRYFLSFMWDV